MQAVIKESLRIFLSATGMMTKVAPAQGDVVEIDVHGTGEMKKLVIPGGTKISIAQWVSKRVKLCLEMMQSCFGQKDG